MRFRREALLLALVAYPAVHVLACGSPDFQAAPGSDGGAGDGSLATDGGDGSASDGAGPDAACPPGKGPSQVRVPTSPSFCIDSTEVTRQHYFDFLESATYPPKGYPTRCANKAGLTSISQPPDPNLPITNVDWCDAWAYCDWAGKRLCGDPAGGEATLAYQPGATRPSVTPATMAKSQWHIACSANATKLYPYGDTFDRAACTSSGGLAIAVGSKPGCQGGYPGIFDMSGNVEEWIDSCFTTTGTEPVLRDAGVPVGTTVCQAPGGAFNDQNDPTAFACNMAWFPDYSKPRPDIGIRCCSR